MVNDMTMPGTLTSDSPKSTNPVKIAASTTPTIVPRPPVTATPPKITMLMISSSMPCAIEGRVDPNREVRSTEAMALEMPVATKSQNR